MKAFLAVLLLLILIGQSESATDYPPTKPDSLSLSPLTPQPVIPLGGVVWYKGA